MKLRGYQSSTLRAVQSAVKTPLQDICVAQSRQSGKSLIAQLLALGFISGHGDVGWLEPSHRQCKSMFRDIKSIAEDHNNVGSYEFKRGSLEVTGSKGTLFFLSAGSADSLRSMHFDLLIIDEAAYTPDAVIDLVQPFRISTQAPCLYVSTKLRKEGRFYETFTDPRTKVFDITPEQIIADWPAYKNVMELFKTKVSAAIYQIDYLNQFLDTSESLLFGNLNKLTGPAPEELAKCPIFVGIDCGYGSEKDYTSIVGVSPYLEKVYVRFAYRVNKGGPAAQMQAVYAALEYYESYVKAIYFESNSLGASLFEQLKEMYKKASKWNMYNALIEDYWNTQQKSDAVSRMVTLCNLSNLVFTDGAPGVSYLKEESAFYGMMFSKSGKMSYGNVRQSGQEVSYHDDVTCGLLHATSAAHSAKTIGIYSVR